MNKFELVSIDDHRGPKFDVRVEGGVPGLISMERGWGVGQGLKTCFVLLEFKTKHKDFFCLRIQVFCGWGAEVTSWCRHIFNLIWPEPRETCLFCLTAKIGIEWFFDLFRLFNYSMRLKFPFLSIVIFDGFTGLPTHWIRCNQHS